MLYPGNSELSAEAQERVTTAFRQAVGKLQEGRREEANIGIEFVLRLDPSFTPAINLRDQLASGAGEIDLSDIVAQMQAPTTDAIDAMLVEAVESYNRRDFVDASRKVEQVLLELPGHQDARQLQRQIQDALKVETQVGQFLAQAREALHRGDPQEAANFVMMAQALDPHHSGIAPTLQEIYASGGSPQAPVDDAGGEPQPPFEAPPEDDFGIHFDELEPESVIGGDAEAAPEAEFNPAPSAEEPAPLWQTMSVQEVSAPPTPPPASKPAPAAPAAGRDDLSDLFEVEGAPAPTATPEEGEPQLDRGKLDELLERGEQCFAAGDWKGAIDAWSRIYLLETEGRGMAERIEEASKHLEEAEQRVEHLVFEAQEAAVGGDAGRALELVDQVLAVEPTNSRALELQARLAPSGGGPPTDAPVADAPAAAAAAAPEEMPELDEDLFDEEAAAEPAPPISEPAVRASETAPPLLDIEVPQRRRILGVPPRTAAIVGAAALVLVGIGLVVVLMTGSDGSKGGGDVYSLRDQAEALFKQGDAAQALILVQAYQATDANEKAVLERLVQRYQKALASPTPTPIPGALIAAQDLLARGLLFHAYLEVVDGLKKHPEDAVLLDLKRRIEQVVPTVEPLQAALGAGNYQTAAGIAADLRLTYPGRADLEEILERSLYNAALAEMRAYNLAGAEGYLRQYEELDPHDETVARIMEFIDKYKARPVDMTLQVFIGSLQTRKRHKLALEGIPMVPTPTPAAAAAADSPTAASG